MKAKHEHPDDRGKKKKAAGPKRSYGANANLTYREFRKAQAKLFDTYAEEASRANQETDEGPRGSNHSGHAAPGLQVADHQSDAV